MCAKQKPSSEGIKHSSDPRKGHSYVTLVSNHETGKSYVAYATSGRGGARAFRPEWCVPAWRESKTAPTGAVRVRQVPAAARQARADWQARYRTALRVTDSERLSASAAGLVVER